MVGGLIMAHGDDDGLRGAAGARARSRSSCWLVRDEDGAGDALPSARRRARAPPACGCELDDRVDTSVRPPGHRLGAQGRARAGRGRPPRPGRGRRHRWSAATPATKAPVPLGERRRRRAPPLLDEVQADAAGRGHRAPRRAAPSRSTTLDEAVEAAADRLGPRPVGARSAPRARPSWPSEGVTVRCLQTRRRRRCPTAEDEPDLVAIVARALLTPGDRRSRAR